MNYPLETIRIETVRWTVLWAGLHHSDSKLVSNDAVISIITISEMVSQWDVLD